MKISLTIILMVLSLWTEAQTAKTNPNDNSTSHNKREARRPRVSEKQGSVDKEDIKPLSRKQRRMERKETRLQIRKGRVEKKRAMVKIKQAQLKRKEARLLKKQARLEKKEARQLRRRNR